MSKISEIMEEKKIVKRKPTLVRRVSDMLKDGSYSGPPLLFRHASMQKIRHCCQNLNLFPYLLYSYDNSKSHPVARKMNLCIGQLLRSTAERFFFIYKNLRYMVLHNIRGKEPSIQKKKEVVDDLKLTTLRLKKFQRQKRKQIPFLLTLAIYLAPLVLFFQLVGLFSLMIFETYTPGFVFLISALMCLAYITLKILFYDAVNYRIKYEKKKVQ